MDTGDRIDFHTTRRSTVEDLIDAIRDRTLVVHPKYTVGFNWTIYQESYFIESILMGIPPPQLFVSENKLGVHVLVGGREHVLAAYRFVTGALVAEISRRSLDPSAGLVFRDDDNPLHGKLFDDLDRPIQNRILNCTFTMHIFANWKEGDEHYELIRSVLDRTSM